MYKMLLSTSLSSWYTWVALILQVTHASIHAQNITDDTAFSPLSYVENTTFNPFYYGEDCNPDAVFKGYHFNHVAFIVKNLTASLEFYTKGLGMRTMFVVQPIESIPMQIVYIGHPDRLANPSSSPLTCEEFTTKMKTVGGLIELLYYGDATHNPDSSSIVQNTLSHIGLIVPNPAETEQRLRAINATIIKEVGKFDTVDVDVRLQNMFGLGPELAATLTEEEKHKFWTAFTALGAKDQLFAADPDGNILEILPAA